VRRNSKTGLGDNDVIDQVNDLGKRKGFPERRKKRRKKGAGGDTRKEKTRNSKGGSRHSHGIVKLLQNTGRKKNLVTRLSSLKVRLTGKVFK